MLHYWNILWDWNTLDSVRTVHSFLEGWALVFFGLLVLFDVLSHLSDDHPSRAKRFERIGLWFFGVAVFAEVLAYPYSHRNDTLANSQDIEQRGKIAVLENSTQKLKTDAEDAHKQAEGFKAQIADANARAKTAEAQVASAKAASDEAVAKVAAADARSAEASAKTEHFRSDIAKANQSAKQAEARAAEANLELARFRAPRTLTVSQQQIIAARLRPFGPRRVDLLLVGDPPEIQRIAEQILASVQGAGWTLGNSGKAIGGPAISGVLVGTKTGSPRDVDAAADSLILSLREMGIAATRFVPQFGDDLPSALTGNWDIKNNAPIRILIGAKP